MYTPRDSGLHRLHPLTKLALAAFLFLSALALPGIGLTYAAFGLLVIPLALWGGVLKELTGAIWRTVLPFAISVFLIQGFLWTDGTPLVGIGVVSLKLEGVLFATATVGRILVVVSSFLLLALTTRPDTLMIALTQRGFPASIAYILVTTIQIIPRFQAKAAAIQDAQRSRGLETEGNLLRRARSLPPLIIPLVLGSLVDVEERALAMEARAFNRPGPKTSLIEIHEAGWEKAARWALLGSAVLITLFRILSEIRG